MVALFLTLVACNTPTPPVTPPPGPPGPVPPPSPPGPGTGQTSFKWSDPAAWGGTLPQAGATVIIPSNRYIVLDVSPPALKGLQIDGALVFDDKDLNLTADWIMVHGGGRLEIGRTDRPYTNRATITLTGAASDESVMGMGTKVLGVMGGSLDLHGEQNRTSWTRLTATAAKGANQIIVQDASGWRVGDRIVIASTDFDPAQAENLTIAAIAGNTITLEKPLAFMHFGQVTNGVDQRGEVGLLSRNIVIRGDDPSATSGFGGHLMVMSGSAARIDGVEFRRMGQKDRLARYPIHFHLNGDNPTSFVKDASIWETFNRCITVHGTNKLLIQSNVSYNTIGHCYFLEDGAETGNRFETNLAVWTRKPKTGEEVIPTDNQAASFWITNPANDFVGNVAAGSENTGIWVALPQHPTGASRNAQNDANVWPRHTALGEFRGNVAHSNWNGVFVDNGPKPDGTVEASFYEPFTDPIKKTGPLTAEFKDITSFKNRNRAIWLRGKNHVVSNAKLADNAIGATFANDDTIIKDSLIVGESENLGTPKSNEVNSGQVGLDGRSLPLPWDADFPIRGFEFYDGLITVQNTRFLNFAPNAKRQASALSYLRFTSFAIDARNHVTGLQLENANPVYYEAVPTPTASEVAADKNKAADGYRSNVFVDTDGSVTGAAGRAVVIQNPFLVDANCTTRPEWGAQVCNNRYGRLWLENASNTKTNIAPVTLTRNDGGSNPTQTMWGIPNGSDPSRHFQAQFILGQVYTYALSGTRPNYLRLQLRDVKAGDWVRVTMPWSGGLFVYQNYYVANQNKAALATSLADLEARTVNAYFRDGDTLHMKLVMPSTPRYSGDPLDWTTLELCGTDLCK